MVGATPQRAAILDSRVTVFSKAQSTACSYPRSSETTRYTERPENLKATITSKPTHDAALPTHGITIRPAPRPCRLGNP